MDELDEIKELLLKVLERLDALEQRLNLVEEDSRILDMYRSLLRAYASILGSTARLERMVQLVSSEIDRSIVRALASKGPLNISQLTEEVRKIRGSASRRIIAERIKKLEDKGIVERIKGRGKTYRLKYPSDIHPYSNQARK